MDQRHTIASSGYEGSQIYKNTFKLVYHLFSSKNTHIFSHL